MEILKKITSKQNDYCLARQPTVAFLGDGVTHGCFEIFMRDGKLETRVKTEYSYHEKVRKILALLYPDAPINIINAGISDVKRAGQSQILE